MAVFRPSCKTFRKCRRKCKNFSVFNFLNQLISFIIIAFAIFLVIKFINVANNPASPMPLQAAPALGIAILIVPLFDTLRVFSLRILSRRSPFSPDRNHLHHLMMDHGMSHSAITYTLVGMNILFIAAAYALRNMNCTWARICQFGPLSGITTL